jgi:hypothetical protein
MVRLKDKIPKLGDAMLSRYPHPPVGQTLFPLLPLLVGAVHNYLKRIQSPPHLLTRADLPTSSRKTKAVSLCFRSSREFLLFLVLLQLLSNTTPTLSAQPI